MIPVAGCVFEGMLGYFPKFEEYKVVLYWVTPLTYELHITRGKQVRIIPVVNEAEGIDLYNQTVKEYWTDGAQTKDETTR